MKSLAVIAALLLTATAVHATNPTNKVPTNTDPEIEVASINLNPICLAAAKGDLTTLKHLIELGADVDATSRGLTPLMYAARYNRTDIIKVLLLEGADSDIKHATIKKTAYDLAKLSNAKEAMEILKKS